MTSPYDGLNLVELLDLLEPVPQPPAIPLTPQTPGWVILALLLFALGFWGIRRIRAPHRAKAYRRAALAELASTRDDAARIAALLRRTALAGYPRQMVAGVTGQDWLGFLDRSYGGTGFSTGPGQVVITAPYQSSTSDPALTTLARTWIRDHKPGQT